MKKVFLAILAVIYLSASSGATVYIQKCMGNTIGLSLLEKDSQKCNKCGMHKNASHDCCSSQVKVFKIHNDQNLSQNNFSKFINDALVPKISSLEFASHFSTTSFKTFASPILARSKISFCVLYCSFLI